MSSAGWGYTMPDTDADRSPNSALGTNPAILREAIPMGLSITISLLAVLTAKPHTDGGTAALTLIWGSTLGLALAHWLAFKLTGRLFTGSRLSPHDRLSLAAQAAAAIGVARQHGAGHARATAYALTVVVIALIVAIGKLLLTGH